MADLTAYDGVLKNVYAKAVSEQLNNATILLKRLQRTTEGFDGRQFVIPTHGRRNEQIGATTSTGTTLPSAANNGYQGYDNAVYKPAYNWGVVQLDQRLIDQTKTNEGAFLRALRSEVQGIADDMSRELNIQFFGDGTGAITACGTTSNSTTVTVTSTANLRTNMPIDVVVASSGATSTGAAGRYVSSIASATTFVISGAAITTDSTFSVYRAGNRNNVTNGLQNIVKATGALATLDPATAGIEYWASTVYANSGTNRTISEVLMQKTFDAPKETAYGSGGTPSLIIGTFGARRAYQNLLTGLKRYVNSTKIEGGFDALEYNGMPFVADRDAPANKIWFLDESRFDLFQVTEPGFIDEDGHVLKWDTNTGYKAVYRWFCQLGVDSRDAHALLSDIAES